MALHRLNRITIGVPDVGTTADYYEEFGLRRTSTADDTVQTFATVDGGEQLRLVPTPRRRLVELRVGADDPDDIARTAAALGRLETPYELVDSRLRTRDEGTDVDVVVEVTDRVVQPVVDTPAYNAPGAVNRPDTRAPGVMRESRVRPRKLGHVVVGSVDQERSHRFFTEGVGFKVSDTVGGLAAFLRCSTDHHNLLVQQAPVALLHHTSWQVDDVDDVGRGASAMLEADPGRHVWGLGRHHIGSNFFWYLKDPAGNFSEYYADMDCIVDDALWTAQDWQGARGLYNWGPPPPPSFLAPEDLAELMASTHAARS